MAAAAAWLVGSRRRSAAGVFPFVSSFLAYQTRNNEYWHFLDDDDDDDDDDDSKRDTARRRRSPPKEATALASKQSLSLSIASLAFDVGSAQSSFLGRHGGYCAALWYSIPYYSTGTSLVVKRQCRQREMPCMGAAAMERRVCMWGSSETPAKPLSLSVCVSSFSLSMKTTTNATAELGGTTPKMKTLRKPGGTQYRTHSVVIHK
eukprot:scaffold23349_cov154-Amphora_coffeaeformis.AAC.2